MWWSLRRRYDNNAIGERYRWDHCQSDVMNDGNAATRRHRTTCNKLFNRRRSLSCKLTDGFEDTFYRVYFNNSVVGYWSNLLNASVTFIRLQITHKNIMLAETYWQAVSGADEVFEVSFDVLQNDDEDN